MGERLDSSRVGSLYSSVSREFSDAEEAITREVQDVMTAPRFTADSMAPAVANYAILREDMKMRAMANQELAQRQQIAFSDSARTELHKQALTQNKDKQLAENTAIELKTLMDQGMAFDEAQNKLIRDNPMRALSPMTIELFRPMGALIEDPHEKYMRENGQKLAELGLQKQSFDAQIAVATGKMEYEEIPAMLANLKKARENQSILLDNQKLDANMEKLAKAHEWKVSQDKMRQMTSLWSKVNEGKVNQADLQHASYVFAKNSGGMDHETLLQSVRPSGPNEYEMALLTDDRILTRFAADQGMELPEMKDLLSILGDPAAIEEINSTIPGAENPNKAKLARAKQMLNLGAGFYQETYRQEAQAAKLEENLAGRSKAEIRDIMKLKGDVAEYLEDPGFFVDDPNNRQKKIPNYRMAQNRTKDLITEIALTQNGAQLGSALGEDERKKMLLAKDPTALSRFPAYPLAGQMEEVKQQFTQKQFEQAEIMKAGARLGLWIDDDVPAKAESETPQAYKKRLDDLMMQAIAATNFRNDNPRNPSNPTPASAVSFLEPAPGFVAGLDSEGNYQTGDPRIKIGPGGSRSANRETTNTQPLPEVDAAFDILGN